MIRMARQDHYKAIMALLYACAAYPEQRVTQVIVNATVCSDPFYVENEDLASALYAYADKKEQA